MARKQTQDILSITGYWRGHLTKKIRASDLLPGMLVLYRLKWYTVVDYSPETGNVTFTGQGSTETKPLHPNFIVTIVDEQAEKE